MDSNLSSNDRLEIVVAKRSADKSVIDDEFQKSFKVSIGLLLTLVRVSQE